MTRHAEDFADQVAFLRARLDEDERLALHRRGRVHAMTCDGFPSENADSGYAEAGDVDNCTCGGATFRLAEVAAKRRIIDACSNDGAGDPTYYLKYPDVVDGLNFRVLCLLALPYADHPDYRTEWRPT